MSEQDPKPIAPIDDDPLATIAALTPSAEEIEVPLPIGKVWYFAPLGNSKDRRKLIEEANKFAADVVDAASTAGVAHRASLKAEGVEFRDLRRVDAQDLSLAYQFHKRSRRPRLTLGTAFKLTGAPETFAFIENYLDGADKSYLAVLRATAREELRGKSETIPSTEDGSISVPASSQGDQNPTSPTENPPS